MNEEDFTRLNMSRVLPFVILEAAYTQNASTYASFLRIFMIELLTLIYIFLSAEAYRGPCQTSNMKLFYENKQPLKAVNYF